MLSILLACAVAMTEAAPGRCTPGCEGKFAPVCGVDGFTYHSACVAECQGVAIAAAGHCAKVPGGSLKTHGKQILQADIDRFKGDGFRLIGSAKGGAFDPAVEAAAMAKDAEKSKGKASPLATEAELTTVRYTTDGLVYARKVPTSQVAAMADLHPQPPLAPLANENAPLSEEEEDKVRAAQRKLLMIFGNDDRARIYTTDYPRSAGGRIESTIGSCSGAMISSRTVLTAAHCIFSRSTRTWASAVTFAPNQLDQRTIFMPALPYGKYDFSYLQTFNGWVNPWNIYYWPYDFASVQLADTTVGQRTGWFGLQLPSGSYSQTLYTEGYPGDKALGTYWATSCWVTDTSRSDGQIYHQCDTYRGQSGSPMYTSSNFIVGVVSWENLGTRQNGAAEITPALWTTLLSWR